MAISFSVYQNIHIGFRISANNQNLVVFVVPARKRPLLLFCFFFVFVF